MEALRCCVNRGRPFGDPNWVTDTAERLGLNGRFGLVEDRRNNHKACHSYLYSPDLVAVTFHTLVAVTFHTQPQDPREKYKMPGVRDRNLRSGDLHEELGLLLLRMVALVAPVPRQEDVGTDAFATLVRPDGSRRLLPDVSFLVQLKAASIGVVSYSGADELAWMTNLEIPLLIGRVDLRQCRIELFSTARLHQVLLEQLYQKLELLLDGGEESSESSASRRLNIGPPIHAWSLDDAAQSDFLIQAHSILRPHVEHLRTNRLLRGIQFQRLLKWETGCPPTEGAMMFLTSPDSDIRDTLSAMVPYVQRLLTELLRNKRYSDFPTFAALAQTMRRWGVDPDPGSNMLRLVASMAEGPDLSDEDIIRLRHLAGFNYLYLNLSYLQLKEESLAAIPHDFEGLALVDVPIADTGVDYLQNLSKLSRLNLAGTRISDSGLDRLTTLRALRWLNIERTQVTDVGIDRLKAYLPDLEVVR